MMMLNEQEISELLRVLDIQEDIKNVTRRVINVAFRKLAKAVHPDKAGDDKTAAFQTLISAYDKLKAYCPDENEPSSMDVAEEDDEEVFFKDNFEQFNFPSENKGSFTVAIEEYLADTWQKYITELLGDPKVNINDKGTICDTVWKVQHGGIEITVHIYNKPKNKKGSKIMVQGSKQSVLCSYVFEELPKIYRLVRLNKPEQLESLNKSRKVPERPGVKCDQCNFKSSLMQMKMHLKAVHGTRTTRSRKRLSNFTPMVTQAKKSKTIKVNPIINNEGFTDTSILLVENTFSGNTTTLEGLMDHRDVEVTNGDTLVEMDQMNVQMGNDSVRIQPLLTCPKCEFDCESPQSLTDHINQMHKPFECANCTFTSDENTVLKDHKGDCHLRAGDDAPIVQTKQQDNKCSKCEKTIRTDIGFVRHTELYCEQCKECLSDRISFDIHMGVSHTKSQSFDCKACEKTFDVELDLNTHKCEVYQERFPCHKCNVCSDTMLQLEWHIETEHEVEAFPCDICKEECSSMEGLSLHIKKHQDERINEEFSQLNADRASNPVQTGNCNNCGTTFKEDESFEKHICTNTHEVKNICDQCEYESGNVHDFVSHVLQIHKRKGQDIFACSLCDLVFNDRNLLDAHMMNCHQMLTVLNGLTRNQQYVSESFDCFKKEMTEKMEKVLQENTEIKQEIFILRQIAQTKSPQPTQQAQPPHHEQPPQQTEQPQQAQPQQRAQRPSVPAPTPEPRASQPQMSSSKPLPEEKEQRAVDQKRILLVGDSISANININVIEKAVGGKVTTAKAYAAIFDNVGSEAKVASRFPTKNFTDVIPEEIKREPFDYLIIQSGSVDITNLNTKDKPQEFSAYFKQEVRFSAKNLFNAAESALAAQPSLKKIVIMTQTPRYDVKSVDPLCLKPALAVLFNNTLGEVWMDSPHNDKIVLGIHNLECSGGIREARYRDLRNQKYDAVHMFGPSGEKSYTISVLDILISADIVEQTFRMMSGIDYFRNLSHFDYQRKKHRRHQPKQKQNRNRNRPDSANARDIRPQSSRRQDTYDQRYSVPTSNVYDHLNW